MAPSTDPLELPCSVIDDAPTARREFLQRIAVAGGLAAGVAISGACAPPAVLASGAPASPPTAGVSGAQWDMSWQQKLARHRTAYDSPEVMHGAALAYAAAAAEGYQQALNVSGREFTPVLILRHAATVMVLNDAMWNRLGLGETQKLKDPTTGEPALRNPFIGFTAGDKFSMVGEHAGLDVLMQRGAVVLTCNRALMGVAYQLRRKDTTLAQETAMAEARASVLPGVYVMPNGIFAVSAAQDAGCHYMKVQV
jgi:hypothetical protein